MASPIPVTGGTGTLRRQVVPRLRHAGDDVRVLSRPAHQGAEGGTKVAEGIELMTGDLATGEGIEAPWREPRMCRRWCCWRVRPVWSSPFAAAATAWPGTAPPMGGSCWTWPT